MVDQKRNISFECARTYTKLGVCHLMESVLLQPINYKNVNNDNIDVFRLRGTLTTLIWTS